MTLDGFAPITGVNEIKFDFASAENGHQGMAELAATTVPEPATFTAILGGTGMLLGLRRRRA